MSTIFQARRPRVKSTRPATIRPVPPTFGHGILDDDSDSFADELHDAAFAARLRQMESDEKLWDREYERVNGRPFEPKPAPAKQYRVTHSTLDSAWELGYRLGRLGVEDASPSAVANHRERAAFCVGHGIGLAEYHREEIAAAEAWCAERERMFEGSDEPWDVAEYNVGSLIGH